MDEQQRTKEKKRQRVFMLKYISSPLAAGTKLAEEFLQSSGDLSEDKVFEEQLAFCIIRRNDLQALKIFGRVCVDGVNTPIGNPPCISLLQYAAEMGSTSIVRWLLEEGADVDAEPGDLFAPIMLATQGGEAEVVRLLLDAGADVNKLRRVRFPQDLMLREEDEDEEDGIESRGHCKAAPLAVAAACNHPKVVELLLNYGADPNLVDSRGRATLFHAVYANARKCLRLLLAAGADVNVLSPVGASLLHICPLVSRSTDVMRMLLKAGADPCVRDDCGETALHTAALAGSAKQVELLLQAGTDPTIRDMDGGLPLWACVSNPDAANVRRLLRKFGGEWTTRDLNESPADVYPLFGNAVCFCTDPAFLQELVDEGAKINIKYKDGSTPLILAIRAHNEPATRFLLEKGADPEVRNHNMATPLMLSLCWGFEKATFILLARGVDLRKCDMVLHTALDYSIIYPRSKKAFLAILDAGAKINTRDILGNTAVHHAIDNKQIFYLRELVRRGVNVDVANKDGQTPLLRAAGDGFHAAVRILLDAGANVNKKSLDADTALSCAVDSESAATVRHILNAMPDSPANRRAIQAALATATEMGNRSIMTLLKKRLA